MSRLARLALLSVWLAIPAGCAHELPPAVEPLIEALVDLTSPDGEIVEVVAHGKLAAAVMARCSASSGALDACACQMHTLIVYNGSACYQPHVRRHEMCHVGQSRRLGMIQYGLDYSAEFQAHGYDGNRFEKECRLVEDDQAAPTPDLNGRAAPAPVSP